jgi:hypothetical protein
VYFCPPIKKYPLRFTQFVSACTVIVEFAVKVSPELLALSR